LFIKYFQRIRYMQLLSIKKSDKSNKKMMAVFYNPKTNRTNTIHFGAAGMSDYTIHKDPERRKRYIARHCKNENWKDPATAGALSRFILWEKTSLSAGISAYKKRFKL